MKHALPPIITCLLLATPAARAQLPILKVGERVENATVYLQSLDMRVEVTGEIATTTFTMTFKNRSNKILEGELLFPLPDGATVSRYALDINGKMREAVPVPKVKATRVFEEIVQRRVDPGLVERVEGNNFRTRVYPIPARGTRTITVGYEQELALENGALRYRLPADYKEAIERFSLRATVWQGDEKPVAGEASREELSFDRQGRDFVATFSRENYRPPRLIEFSLPVSPGVPRVWMQPADGSHYFVASCLPDVTARDKAWADHLGVIWDVSLSGLQRDARREIELLGEIIKQKKELSITLYLLNNRFAKSETFRIRRGEWAALRAKLEAVTHDGGTDYAAINLDDSPAREFLLFSDGLSTLGDAEPVNRHRYPVHCIVSSPVADYSTLKRVALETGGKFINLNALSPVDASRELTSDPLQFLGVAAPDGVREVYPSIVTPARGNFSVAGILDVPRAEVTLLFGRAGKVEQRVKVVLQASDALQGNVHRAWAQKKIAELDIRYEQNKEELIALGQQFGIVTRETSLLVLESVQDYLTYDITPPRELLDEYRRLKKQQEEVVGQVNLMDNAISMAGELQRWWETDFAPAKPRYPQPDVTNNTALGPPPRFANVAREVNNEDVADLNDHEVLARDAVLEEAVVTGYARPRDNRAASDVEMKVTHAKVAAAPVQPVIRLAPLKQDKEYLESLTGDARADYATYLSLRPAYITTPAYFFDMADWFFRLGDRETALRILTSIADMGLEEAPLYRLLGYRLREYGAYPLALHACRQVIRWRPQEPQSYRDQALALADAGRRQEALDSLRAMLARPYDRQIAQRFARGIEEVVVTEINQLAATARLDTSGIDRRLLPRPMPVDIRVVLNWNMNNTDIDLHVTDPTGETCSYQHTATATGGRISRDITQGYGPEQFMIKKAVPGKYEVFVNYYGDSQVKISGPSTLLLEIYTRYADKQQKRELVCLQMDKEMKAGANGLVKVAEFEF